MESGVCSETVARKEGFTASLRVNSGLHCAGSKNTNPKHEPQTAMQADQRYYTDLPPQGCQPKRIAPI